jgi:hypothetical protein
VINLAIKRNDPCPCGSGKKYKKCCLSTANVIQIQEVKEERFFQNKHMLVLKLRDFMNKEVPANEYYQLQSEFRKRSQHAIKGKYETGFFEFWLFFFHRFENGLRGIEWFTRENAPRLSEEERQMANTWQELTPKIVQAVNKEADIIYYEDRFTNKQYRVPFIKNDDPAFVPWYGTIGLLEPFEQLFYFNGVRVFEDPMGVNRAVKKVEELAKTVKQSHEQVLFDYYPEVIAALKTDEAMENTESKEISEYTLQYNVLDEEALSVLIESNQQFMIDTWEKNKKLCSWVDSWYVYTDSEISKPIHIAELYGKFSVENNVLKLISLDHAHVEEFKQLMESLVASSALSFKNEKINTLTIPSQAEIRELVVSYDKDTPQYFALYAQNNIQFELDQPIGMFNGLSIRELIDAGRKDDADNWLKQMEYNMYLQVQQQFKQVLTTADYNTIRKELGLALSPFVTGGENRASTFEKLTTQNPEGQHVVKKEDIPYYEQLGFTPDNVNTFYSDDFVAFFKEKTEGKSENTIRKYRASLTDLRKILENYKLNSWENCDQEFWTRVFLIDFIGFYEVLTKTAIKDFISTTKALAKWLDQQKKTSSLAKVVVQVAKETEDEMMRSVEVYF